MDNQQTQALFQAANAASVSLNQLAAAIAEASGVLQALATTANAAGYPPVGGQTAPQTFQQPGGAPMGQQPQYAPPGGSSVGQPQQHAAPGAPVGNQQPAPSGAPGAAPDTGKRKRRTRAEIAADEAAIAAGYTSHADMVAKTGGTSGVLAGASGAPTGPGQAAPNMQQTPMAQGNGPVQGMQSMQPGMSGAPQQPAGPTPDEAQKAFIRVINAVEQIWPGHGQGQAGILFNRYGGGVANVGMMTPEKRGEIIQWCDFFIQELQAGRLPNGAEGLPAPNA